MELEISVKSPRAAFFGPKGSPRRKRVLKRAAKISPGKARVSFWVVFEGVLGPWSKKTENAKLEKLTPIIYIYIYI